jgi:hypothetical protein
VIVIYNAQKVVILGAIDWVGLLFKVGLLTALLQICVLLSWLLTTRFVVQNFS